MNLIARGQPLDATLDAIAQAVEVDDPGLICSILLLDAEGRRLQMGAAPSLPDAYNRAIHGLEIGPTVGSCGTAAYMRRRVVVEDIAADPLWADFRDLAASAGLASCWSQPIFSACGAVAGTFAIYQRRPSAPDEEDIAFIEAAAELAAIAIDRRKAELVLADSEARANETARDLSTFFDVSLDMMIVRDMDGRFVKVSRAWETNMGYPVESLEGKPALDLLHPDDVEATRAQMAVADQGGQVDGFVNRYRRVDGTYRQLEWRARRAGDFVFSVARDVTERLRIEADMVAARAAAEAANQAKSDFLANMSHEIRTPLNGMIGVAAALAEMGLTPAQSELVELIRGSGATLERLVSDILDVSKIEAGQLSIETHPFELTALDGPLEMARLRAEGKGLSLRVERGAEVEGSFVGDSVRIRQVLGNLLSNAIKFTDRGEIVVRVRLEPGEGVAPPRLRLEVEDTGVGFRATQAELIFQRFSQADATITRRFGGSGLGLSISKALVEMMGGEIAARSEPGLGSLFTVVLPLPRAKAAPPVVAPPPAPPVVEGEDEQPLRVLLAEDHPVNQRVVQLLLEPYGAAVTVVENGALAVEAFERGDYDVVLMDMQMPVMDGLAATRAIRDLERARPTAMRTPVIMLSANAMTVHRQAALRAGADLHVAKPVTAAALIGGVNEALSTVRSNVA